MLLGDAFAAADRAGRVEWREGGGGPLHVSSGDTRLTVAVAPGSYQTSPDGRDWADGGTAPDGGYGPRVAFDSEADGVAPFLPPAGRADRVPVVLGEMHPRGGGDGDQDRVVARIAQMGEITFLAP